MSGRKERSRSEETAKSIRRQILDMAYAAGRAGSHLGGSLSMVELLAVLYTEILHYRADDPAWEERDRVIFSKGHAAMALYPALAAAGIISTTELATFKQDGSKLGAHPSLNGLPGIEFASGSLGLGLSTGVGVCLALRRKGNAVSRVFVLMGDGECDEGSVWEAAASAAHYGLDRLVAIIDQNGLQYDGATVEILDMAPMEDKWRSFGWDVLCIDGHDTSEIRRACLYESDRPLAILAGTVKGKGISFMENNGEYHNAVLTKALYERAAAELEQDR